MDAGHPLQLKNMDLKQCTCRLKGEWQYAQHDSGSEHVSGARAERERSVSGAENGAERAENRLERRRAVRGVQKTKWSVSGAGAGGRRNGNRAVSGQNLSLKVRSTIKLEPLKLKSSKSILKVTTTLSE